MKSKLVIAFVATTISSFAATSFSGSGVVGAKNSLGTANVTTGNLAMLIVDIDNNGFLGMGSLPGGSLLTALSDPDLTSAQASLVAGQLFGGDRIVTVTNTGASGSIANLLPSQDISAYFGKAFAVVWFDGLATAGAPTSAPSGAKYGIIRGNDWTFPIADVAGALTFNSTDNGGASTLWQANAGTKNGITVNGFASTVDGTNGAATFVIVPEPSSVMLGAIGAIGLLRRRRK